MSDLLTTVLVILAILLVADLVFAGGAMTMGGMGAMMGVAAHPLVAGVLIALIIGAIPPVAGGRI